MTTVPEMDNDDDSSPPVDSNQLQGMSLSELKKHRKLLKKGLKVGKAFNHHVVLSRAFQSLIYTAIWR